MSLKPDKFVSINAANVSQWNGIISQLRPTIGIMGIVGGLIII
ncbi:MAG: hypothetical protein OEV58_16485 [Gammaproteobacteria bacterium]|nr:hypothetical protein [Gammaproteobacteria bacterium]